MIYTLTLNPSLDYIVDVNDFEIGGVNRTKYELILPGGKGINVSIVLSNLGIDNTAWGFVAGFVGEEIINRLENMNIKTDFIKLESGVSRINMTLRNVKETSINGMGAVCTPKELSLLMDKLCGLGENDILVISGSVPNGILNTVYKDIIEEISARNIKFVVDTTRKYLMEVLEYKPFLVKPNQSELEEIFDVKLNGIEEIVFYAKKLQQMGAINVLVSRGGDGALLVAENDEIYISQGIQGEVVNTIGAGDSMVAGFLAGYVNTGDFKKAFYKGVAAGTASAFTDKLATLPEIEGIYKHILENS